MNIADMFQQNLNGELTHEMIQTQLDVGFISELRKELEYIKSTVDTNDIRSASKLDFNYPEAMTSFRKLSDILTNRFGFNINLFLRDHRNASTNVVTHGSFNVLNGDNSWYDDIKKHFDNITTDTFKKLKTFTDFTKNVDDYYNILYNNIKELEKQYDKLNIVIDNKNARITGLPKDYSTLLTLDICYYFNSKGLGMSVDEVIAIILHEIGHNFTSFEKMYYRVKNSIVILEAIRETKANNINDNVSLLRLVSKSLGGPVKGDGALELLVDVRNKFTGNYGEDTTGVLSRTAAEQQADQFVSRFGMGAALVKSLSSGGFWIRPPVGTAIETITSAVMLSVVWTLYIGVLIVLSPALIFGFGALMIAGLALFGIIISTLLTGTKDKLQDYFKYHNLYELDYKRFLRVKQDYVRQLRMLDSKVDKSIYNNLLSGIAMIDSKLRDIDRVTTIVKSNSMLEKYFINNMMDMKTKSLLNINDMSQALMENDLHYKLKTMKG